MPREIDELFYRLELRTKGFEEGVERSKKAAKSLTEYIAANPTAAFGALGAAAIYAGVKITEMAAKVDVAGRQLRAVLPMTNEQFQNLRTSAREMSGEFGIAQDQVLQLFRAAAREGARSAEEVEAFSRATIRLNTALGRTEEQLPETVSRLDQILDLFHLNADAADDVGKKIFAMANGRVAIDDLFAAMQQGADDIQKLGIGLDDAVPALVALLESGLSGRQAAAQLSRFAAEGTKGRDAVLALATESRKATKDLDALEHSLAGVEESADRSAARIRERLNNAMIDLGNKILPVVAKNLENISTILDHISGRSQAFGDLEEIANVANATRRGRRVNETARDFTISHLAQQVQEGDLRLGELSSGQIADLTRNLQALDHTIQNPSAEAARVKLLQQLHRLARPADASTPGGPTTPVGSTPDELATGEAALGELRKTIAGFTSDLADDTRAALEDFRTKMQAEAAKIPPEQKAQFDRLVQQVIDQYHQQLVIIRSGIENVSPALAPRRGPPPLPGDPTGAAHRAAGEKAVAASVEEINKALTEEERKRQANIKAAEEELSKAQAIAYQITQAVRGVLQLADAFGLVDETTSSILQNVADVAAGIGPLVKSIKGFEAGKLGIGSVIGSALPIIGGIASLADTIFGDHESPQEQARREALEHNTTVIEKLTQEIGNLGLPGVTGNDLGEALAGIAGTAGVRQDWLDFFEKARREGHGFSNDATSDVFRKQLKEKLDASGTSFEDLQKLADSLGLDVNFMTNNVHDLQEAFAKLNEAIRQSELTKFAETFEGQMQSLQARFELFDITDPIKQLQALIDVQKKTGSSAIAGAFAGLDLNTAGGRAQAELELQKLFEQLNSAQQLSPEDQAKLLGGLTGDEFLQALLQMKQLLDAANANGGTGQTAGFAVSRTITEVTGNRLAGILSSSDARLQELVELTRTQNLLISGGSPIVGLQPGAPIASGGDVNIERIEVSVPIPAGTDPSTAGVQAATSFAATLDRVLGRRVKTKARQFGNPIVSR